jgi:Leucine-rich repeat (LRR) protein
LKSLQLIATKITDASLASIAKLANLDTLYLSHTRVGDAGMKHLAALTKLKDLGLSGTKVTVDGVVEIQKALPDCKITWDDAAGVDVDRRAAQWAIEKGGRVEIRVGDGPVQVIDGLRQLPTKPFKTTLLNVASVATPSGSLKPLLLQDADLLYLKGLDRLHLLAIDWTQLTGKGIAQLDALPSLDYLILIGEKPAPDDVWNAVTALKKLKALDFQGAALTPEQAQSLRTMPNLTSLGLTFMAADVAESALPAVGELGRLENLMLIRSGVSDAALPHVARLTNLKYLGLQDTRITDTGLERLAALKKLTQVQLQRTKVTAAGVAKLQAALPQCKIEWDGAK